MKKREKVTAFDFETAFKALDELDIPKVSKKQNNLNEHFIRSNVTNVLIEDYYNVNDVNDLEQAQSDRQEEIAQAKLARIEKIVDINAESPEDILPSYVGKNIIQCPQCMTLFYKDPEDIEISEEDETVCNVSEICQHCGNDSGYTLIGKVEAVEEVVEESQLEEIPVEETEGQDEEELDNEEVSEEENVEDQQEEVEEPTEENEEEVIEESLNEESDNYKDAFEKAIKDKAEKEGKVFIDVTKDLEEISKQSTWAGRETLDQIFKAVGGKDYCILKTDGYHCFYLAVEESKMNAFKAEKEKHYTPLIRNVNEELTEAVDKELDDKLKAHNDYIEYLKDEIEKAEKELENAKNEFVKKSIEARLDSLKTDLEAALPEVLKGEVQDELPAADEIEEVKESLTENLNEESAKELLQDFANSLGEDLETEEKLAEFEQSLEESTEEDKSEDIEDISAAIESRFSYPELEKDKQNDKMRENFVDDVSREEFRDMLNNPVYYESVEDDKNLQEGIFDVFNTNIKRANWLLQNAKKDYEKEESENNKVFKGIQVWGYDIVLNSSNKEINPSNGTNKKVNNKKAYSDYKVAVQYAENWSKISSNGIAEVYLIDAENKPIIIARYFQGKLTEGTKDLLTKVYEKEYAKYKQVEADKKAASDKEKADKKAEDKRIKSDEKALNKVNNAEGEDVLDTPKEETKDKVKEEPKNISEVCINGYVTLYKVGTWKAVKFAADANLEDIKNKAMQMSNDVKSEVKVNAKKVSEVKDFKNELELLFTFKDGNLVKDSSKEAYEVLLKIKNEANAPIEEESAEEVGTNESLNNRHMISIQEVFEDIEEIDTNSLQECIEKATKDSEGHFILESCELTSLGCEICGTFIPNDIKTSKPAKYIFNEAYLKDNQIILRGIDEQLNSNIYTLYCSLNDKKDTIITESFNYNK